MWSMPPGTISLLRVWSDSAPINSEKSMTELNGPRCTNLEYFEFNSRFRNLTTLIAS
jgi:hypothetical protein